MIIDAHLDLAYNASIGRDVTLPAARQTADEQGTPSVGLPDLRAGGVELVCGTIFCMPDLPGLVRGYRSFDEAHAAAQQQIDYYRHLDATGQIRLIRRAGELSDLANPGLPRPSVIILMEGADPIRTPGEVAHWFDAGVRAVGLAWRKTRYAGGTGAPGPLSAEGVELVKRLDECGFIHDASHLAEESFWQLLRISAGPVMASHSNCRAIVPTDRQLSDEMIRALAERGGIIGINLFDKFLLPPDELGTRPVTLADVVGHIRHVCDLVGDVDHVGIGTDMDGGFGVEHLPEEIRTSADLPRLADALTSSGFSQAQTQAILSDNWLRFFRTTLPA